MTPSNRWFPASLQERAAWFENFANQFTAVHLSLGFTAADEAAVSDDNELMQFLAGTELVVRSYRSAVRQYRKIITEGKIGDPTPAFPAGIAPAPPSVRLTGIFERLDNLVRRIRVAPAYTDEIGALLGIIPAQTEPESPEEMQPVSLKARAVPGNIVEVNFARGTSDGVAVEMKVDKEATWSDAGKFFKSPATISIPQNADRLPRAVQLRLRYLIDDKPVGHLSDVLTTQTIP